MNIETAVASKSVSSQSFNLLKRIPCQEVREDIKSQKGRGLVIADATLEDVDVLLAQLEPGTDLWRVELCADFSGLLKEALSCGYERIHLLGHGQPGAITLGVQQLQVDDFAVRSDVISSATPSLHFWSCLTGAGEKGLAFVDGVAQALGAAVTAFSGLVGAGSKGGSWLPDVFSGNAGSVAAPFENALAYGHTLLLTVDLDRRVLGLGRTAVFTEIDGSDDASHAVGFTNYEGSPNIIMATCLLSSLTVSIDNTTVAEGDTLGLGSTTIDITSAMETGEVLFNDTYFNYGIADSGNTRTITFTSLICSGGNSDYAAMASYELLLDTLQFNSTSDTVLNGSTRIFSVIGYSGETSTTPAPFQVTMVATNDAPTLTKFEGPVGTGKNETHVTITFANLLDHGDEADLDGTVNAFVIKAMSSGTVLIGTDASNAKVYDAATNNVIDATHNAYWMADSSANGIVNAFTAVARDDGGAESITAVQATVSVTPVNDAPTSTSDMVTTDEDTTTVVSLADFGTYADPEGTALDKVQITTLESAGALQYHDGTSWTDVILNQEVTAADIIAGKLRFEPAANASGGAYATLGYKVSDGFLYSTNAYTLTVNVTAVNDLPTVSCPLATTVAEGDSSVSLNLLANAHDDDLTDTLRVGNVTYTVNGVPFALSGITMNGNTLTIDPSSPVYNAVAQGEQTTIVVSYQVIDSSAIAEMFFAIKADYATGAWPYSVTSADVNGDGKSDLIVANGSSSTVGNTVSVLVNHGDGTFDDKVDYVVGYCPVSVTSADINGDGKPDLIVANGSSSTVSVLVNNGYGTFVMKVDYATGFAPESVVSADVNGDGKSDLIVANANSNTVSVLVNNGYGTFATKVDYATGSWPYSVTTADVTGDGKLDLVVADYGSNTVSVLVNHGDGTFVDKVDYVVGASPRSVTSADVNGDGKSDLIVTNSGVSVLLNKGDGTFADKVDYATGALPYSVTSADVNGDGKSDLIVANHFSDTVSVLKNNGDGTFATAVDYATGLFPYSVTSADVNGDGKSDLIMTNFNSATVSVLINNSTSLTAYPTTTETITINGTNDAPVVTNSAKARHGSVIEAGYLVDGSATASGKLTASDVDTGATLSWSIADTMPASTYGSIAINANTGVWTYTLDDTKAATQALHEGETVIESYTARVTDEFGTYADQTVTVTINGTNDAPLAPTFNINGYGKSVADFGLRDTGSSIFLQADGKILVAGSSSAGVVNSDFVLMRFNADGRLDRSFSGVGKLMTDFGGMDSCKSLIVQSDGQILAAGVSDNYFALARYNPDGTLDTSFSDDGKVTTNIPAYTTDILDYYYAKMSVVQVDKKILLAGGSNQDFVLMRFNMDGTPDTTFSDDGKLTTDFNTRFDHANSLIVQSDGKILVAGFTATDAQLRNFAIARYNQDGILDTTFSDDGKLITDFVTGNYYSG